MADSLKSDLLADSGLSYTDNVSIAWRVVDHDLDDEHLALVNASNESFLRDVAVIGDGVAAKDLADADSAVGHELHRIDLKLNLILDLVSNLIYRQADIPATSPVQVSATGVTWTGDVPAPGSTVFLELFIQRGLPKPLCCYGEVVSSADAFARDEATVRFVGLTGATQAWLEKLIFRHHRREVAFQRSMGEA